jgi:Rieske Fe-S protein
MERRTFLRWAVHGMGAVFGAVLGFPAAVYLIDPRNRPARQTDFHPVARVSELPVNVPREVVIHETRRDAWTLHPDNVVGRVWLVRKPGTDPSNGEPLVDVFTTACPHLNCSVNFNESAGDFLCPCHGGHFRLDGTRIDPGTNPAPRNMDSLEKKFERPPDAPQDWVVLVKFEKFEANVPQKVQIA